MEDFKEKDLRYALERADMIGNFTATIEDLAEIEKGKHDKLVHVITNLGNQSHQTNTELMQMLREQMMARRAKRSNALSGGDLMKMVQEEKDHLEQRGLMLESEYVDKSALFPFFNCSPLCSK